MIVNYNIISLIFLLLFVSCEYSWETQSDVVRREVPTIRNVVGVGLNDLRTESIHEGRRAAEIDPDISTYVWNALTQFAFYH